MISRRKYSRAKVFGRFSIQQSIIKIIGLLCKQSLSIQNVRRALLEATHGGLAHSLPRLLHLGTENVYTLEHPLGRFWLSVCGHFS
jgi:hypothetical protein